MEQPGGNVAAEWRPEHTGLVCAPAADGVKGGSQWVLPGYRDLYAAGGASLQQRCDSVHATAGPGAVHMLLADAHSQLKAGTLSAFLSAGYP